MNGEMDERFLKYVGIDRGHPLALLRIRLGPVIQLFNMSRGFLERRRK